MKNVLSIVFLLLLLAPTALAEIDWDEDLTPAEEDLVDEILEPVMSVYNAIKYAMTVVGVIIFPIGIFFFFIPPLKGIGKFILSTLAMMIFITFFDMLIIVASSMLIDIPLFSDVKILVMITAFGMVCLTLLFAFIWPLKEATTSGMRDTMSKAVKYVALLFV